MKKIILNGFLQSQTEVLNQLPSSEATEFDIIQSVKLGTTRDAGDKLELEPEADDIVYLEFEDGGEWIGSASDIAEIRGLQTASDRSADTVEWSNRIYLSTSDSDRNLVKSIVVKAFHLIRPKVKEKLAGEAAKKIGERLDRKLVQSPGLYEIGATFTLNPINELKRSTEKYLLLIHGTANHTLGSFGDLNEDTLSPWSKIHKAYDGRTLAAEHHTLAVSPFQNALETLKALPENLSIDILSQSRGGLVADILARCSVGNAVVGFTSEEVDLMRKEDEESALLMTEINTIAAVKNLRVGRVIRVSSPSNGTALMSEGLDRFLNVLLNGVQVALGNNMIYSALKGFLLEVISQRANPKYLPGLAALKQDSIFQKVMNNPQIEVRNELFVIGGDAEFGKTFKQSILVILSNLYYRKPNDFIVETESMDKGVRRESGFYFFLSKTSETQHFKYFRNPDSRLALLEAIAIEKEKFPEHFSHSQASTERGIILKQFSLHEKHVTEVTGTKPIVVLLPGIMGSILRSNDEMIWVDFPAISKGKIAKSLKIDSENVTASGVVDEFYGAFVAKLKGSYDVVTFPFDWRLSVKDAAANLEILMKSLLETYDQPLQIVAHSMGGVVVKQLMRSNVDFWTNFMNRAESKLIMLGTPWMGSYLIMEVLTGHSSRVNQLSMLDLRHSKKELLAIFNNYPGIYDLLPIDDRPLENPDFWKQLNDEVNDDFVLPPTNRLTDYSSYKTTSAQENLDLKNCWYICGKAPETVFNYTISKRWSGKKIEYQTTNEGDGSVTWATGIPKQLNKDNLYYCLTEHGQLANDPKNFDAIIDILRTGKTERLLRAKPTYRSGEIIGIAKEVVRTPRNIDELKNGLFGLSDEPKESVIEPEELYVSVVNADLREATYPVMVGHFLGDAIVNAEGTIDRCMDGRLTERKLMGAYPSRIGENDLFFNLESNPSQAIVIGLGEVDQLTTYKLMLSVEKAILALAIQHRDNPISGYSNKKTNGITCLPIASDFGKLPVRECVKAILTGVINANAMIRNASPNLPPITHLEFIDFYEEVATQAYLALNELKKADIKLHFSLEKKLAQKRGARKRQSAVFGETWWHQFSTESVINKNNELVGLNYSSSAGIARVATRTIYTGIKQVQQLLQQLSTQKKWDPRLSKTLFELLVPNEFKEIIRNQNHIVWKFDIDSAQFPWEMFHDMDYDTVPTFVNSGLIRQLYTSDFGTMEFRVPNNHALIVGDPLYNDTRLSQLPGAEKEARMVSAFFRENNIETRSLISKESTDIMMALFSQPLRFMHFAGHGLYDPENGEIGIAIGNGITISPQMFRQLSYVPEFVFINCCYSGTVNATDHRYFRSRYQLAANIGVELIEMGVKAVVVTGWAVDDEAAETFARMFYEHMFLGYTFGEAVQLARKVTYNNHVYSNTWGAYQCYGDPYYTFHSNRRDGRPGSDYVLPNQVYQDLDSVFHAAKHGERSDQAILTRVEEITDNAQRNGFDDAIVKEKTAMIYLELDLSEKAYRKYEELLYQENAYFSVKALELYCYLKARIVSSEKIRGKKDIDGMLKEIEKLLNIGETRERHCVIGYAYQKAAFLSISKSPKSVLGYLTMMFDQYALACAKGTDMVLIKSTECLVSKTLAAFALAQYGETAFMNQIVGSNKIHARTYFTQLDERITVLRETGRSVDLALSQAHVALCLLLLSSKPERQMQQKIEEAYKSAFKHFSNSKKITEELENYLFLNLLPLDNTVKHVVTSISKLLEQYKSES